MQRSEREALVAGLIAEEELKRLRQSLEQAQAEATFFAHLCWIIIVGRKVEATSG